MVASIDRWQPGDGHQETEASMRAITRGFKLVAMVIAFPFVLITLSFAAALEPPHDLPLSSVTEDRVNEGAESL